MTLFSMGFPTGMEGLTYPIPFADPEALIELAQHAEKLGYHSIWGNDHMTTPRYVRDEFPVPPRFWEPLTTFSFLAGHTTTLRFGTAVLVLPMRRDIVVTAKQIATLDQLSNGRAEICVGVGSYREEFQALNPHGKVHRGDMVEEGVEALQRLFKERVTSFEGKYYQFQDVELYPKPKQDPFPLYFGGNNANHLRRAAKSAEGWVPASLPLETLRSMVEEFRSLTEAEGRDFSKMQVAPSYMVHLGKTHEQAISRFHESQMFKHAVSLREKAGSHQSTNSEGINLVGSFDAVVERALAYKEAGVTHFLGLFFAANSVPELKDQMQMFAEEIGPHIR